MVIIAREAEVVRTIYKSFVQGVHPSLISTRLNALGLKTVYGNNWSSSAVRNILRNEKYCGDVLMQKTITVDYLSHISKPNEGEAEQYYIADHHDAIVSREMWDKAQELLKKLAKMETTGTTPAFAGTKGNTDRFYTHQWKLERSVDYQTADSYKQSDGSKSRNRNKKR
jgi:hypothetical protein